MKIINIIKCSIFGHIIRDNSEDKGREIKGVQKRIHLYSYRLVDLLNCKRCGVAISPIYQEPERGEVTRNIAKALGVVRYES